MFTHIHTPISKLHQKELFGKRFYTDGVVKYPSITTVLSNTADKEYLKEWELRVGANAKKELKRCCDRGTEVHHLCEQYLKNNNINTDNKLFNQIKPHLKKINNIRLQETALKSDVLQVAGTVDLIAEYNNRLCVVDFKTSNHSKTEANIYDYFLQETFYALAFYESTGEYIEDIITIIAVEKNPVPQLFVKKIDKYIVPLQKRISMFNK